MDFIELEACVEPVCFTGEIYKNNFHHVFSVEHNSTDSVFSRVMFVLLEWCMRAVLKNPTYIRLFRATSHAQQQTLSK